MTCCTWHGATQLVESEPFKSMCTLKPANQRLQETVYRSDGPAPRWFHYQIQEFFQAPQDRSVCFCLCCLTDCSQPKARSVHVKKVIVFSLFVHLSASCHQCHQSRGTALWNHSQASVVPSFTVLLLCLPALPAACVAGNCIELMWRRRKLS